MNVQSKVCKVNKSLSDTNIYVLFLPLITSLIIPMQANKETNIESPNKYSIDYCLQKAGDPVNKIPWHRLPEYFFSFCISYRMQRKVGRRKYSQNQIVLLCLTNLVMHRKKIYLVAPFITNFPQNSSITFSLSLVFCC